MKVLRGLGRLPRTPDQQFIPVHMHLGPRTRSQVTIWSLPEEVLLHLLTGLHVTDVLNMRLVHHYFRDLIDNCTTIWTNASFEDTWPSSANIKHFKRAAKHGNIEACVKLGVAYLYNEGLPGDFDGKRITSNGEKAAQMFCKVESLLPQMSPFTWLFIRPPWSLSGACCKECVFTYMKAHLEKTQDSSVMICVAKILALLDDEEKVKQSREYLQAASDKGSSLASYLLWEEAQKAVVHDRAGQLESIRQLRGIAEEGDSEAQLALCRCYVNGKYGGIEKHQAAAFVRGFVQSSKPSNAHKLFRSSSELTPSMRYILVDWLVEVAGMKDFSTQTLHVAIDVVDRYLKLHKTSRSKLQLLGVAAMVICSRFLGKDIITIREAAWLTDNTYKYEDVVRMMGEISATLKGNFRVFTSLDYVELFSTLAGLNAKAKCLTELMCELTLLHAEMGQFTAAEIAACSVLLARLVLKEEFPWPQKLEEFTGFSINDLHECARTLHRKCFLDGAMIDHREVTLQAVKQRYSDDRFQKVGEIKMMTTEELYCQLGITEESLSLSKHKQKLRKTEELIVSPSRTKSLSRRCDVDNADRTKASTPTIDVTNLLNESAMSGYEGDHEDEELEDSVLDQDGYYSDAKSPVSQDAPFAMEEDDTYFASLHTSFDIEKEKQSSLELMLPSWMSPTKDCDLFQQLHQKTDDCEMNGPSSSGVSTSPRSPDFSPFRTFAIGNNSLCAPLCPSPSAISYSGFNIQMDSSESEVERSAKGANSNSLVASFSSNSFISSYGHFAVKKHSSKRKSSRQHGNATKAFIVPQHQ
ncbi:cyclin-F-like isoform X2 [Liolophura sinensis]|uniref:cyclin-F-like isoform X2 n=1 Tax=Liolophura sinensis TaxID=3198878 RepID=UPI003158AF9B